MASEGWIKLHRCLFKKAIWLQSTPEQKVVLITLLGMANHCGKEWEWQGKQFKAEPGQFVTSLESITKKCGKGISMQNVRSSLKKFEKYEFLTQEVTKTGRLINIVNWELYQGLQEETNKETTKDLTKNQQTGNKELTTNKNDKNDKNDKDNNSISKDILVSPNVDTVIKKWNELGLSKIISIKNNRLKLLKARINEYSLEEVIKAIEMINDCNFLKGQNNRNWIVDIDWFLKPNNFVKVLEGKYLNKDKKQTKNAFDEF